MPPAFIVDGQMEKKIVQKLCAGAPVRTTNLNGINVAIGAIGKAVGSLIRLLRGRYFPIFIILDREGRTETSEEIEERLRSELINKVNVTETIIVACPDRMIENWILGDVGHVRTLYNAEMECCEGKNGKAIIRRLLWERRRITYHEATVGVEMFIQLNPREVSTVSSSFRRLRDRADPYCPWLRRIQ
jgi:hypothetical protein